MFLVLEGGGGGEGVLGGRGGWGGGGGVLGLNPGIGTLTNKIIIISDFQNYRKKFLRLYTLNLFKISRTKIWKNFWKKTYPVSKWSRINHQEKIPATVHYYSLLRPFFSQLIAQIAQKWRLNKNSVFPRRRSTNEWSGIAPQQPTPIRWLHPPIRILHNPRGGASSSIPLYDKLSDWSRALKGLRTLEMHVQGQVTNSKRESHRYFQTIDTRAPLIGQTPKHKENISKIS